MYRIGAWLKNRIVQVRRWSAWARRSKRWARSSGSTSGTATSPWSVRCNDFSRARWRTSWGRGGSLRTRGLIWTRARTRSGRPEACSCNRRWEIPTQFASYQQKRSCIESNGGWFEPAWPVKSGQSCPKMISLEKHKIMTPLQKLPKYGQFGQNNCCHRLWKVAQSAIYRPIWSHWFEY